MGNDTIRSLGNKMRLEATLVGHDSAIGMAQLQSQLPVLALQMQEVVKGKEVRMNVWCTICRREGHHKSECPDLVSYAATNVPNPFRGGNAEYCEICKKWGHHTRSCTLLEKYQKTYHKGLATPCRIE